MQNSKREKKVVFITSKNLSYIRNVQEINLLNDLYECVEVIGSQKKSYVKRILEIYASILRYNFKETDIVFIGFAPQLILPIWRWKFRNKVIVIDFFISVYDTFVNDRKKFKSNSIVAKFMKLIDRHVLKVADYYVADTKEHAKYFQTEFGAEVETANVLYLEADKKFYYPRRVDKKDTRYTVLYFGSILPLQGVEVILQALEVLKNEDKIHFIMVGPIGSKYKKVYSDNIEYIDWLPQEKLSDYIAEADLCLAGHFNAEIGKARRTIPGKAYIYESMNKKMILGDNNANRELFEEDERHCFVKMGDYNELANKIRFLAEEERQ